MPLKRHWYKPTLVIVWGLLSAFLIFIFTIVLLDQFRPAEPLALGATFSAKYARELGLDPRVVFTASLDELGVRRFRIPVYWDEVEPQPDALQFEEVDWMLEEAGRRNAEIILAIGYRVPRWPECHSPEWARDFAREERNERILNLIRATVAHYRASSAVIAWQVENEPLLEIFGECPEPDREFLKREVALVRELDSRPIIITESGELSSWLRTVGLSDILGISMYRTVWNRLVGYRTYPFSPSFYRYRAELVRPWTSGVIVTELQAEPWVIEGVLNAPIEEQFKSMNPWRLRENVSFAARAGFRETYLWGIEWWYWLGERHGEWAMWETGQEAFRASAAHLPLRPKER